MSGKSRRHAKKHHARSKKERSQSQESAAVRRQASSQVTETTALPGTASPATRTAVAAPVSDRYSYIFPELKRIGILAGIIMVVLIVLALVLT